MKQHQDSGFEFIDNNLGAGKASEGDAQHKSRVQKAARRHRRVRFESDTTAAQIATDTVQGDTWEVDHNVCARKWCLEVIFFLHCLGLLGELGAWFRQV